jgi:STE24 endopeptidase
MAEQQENTRSTTAPRQRGARHDILGLKEMDMPDLRRGAVSETRSTMSLPDLERQCDRYARLKLWLSALEFVILVGTLASFTLTGAASAWFQALSSEVGEPWQASFLYLAGIAAAARLAVLPVQFLSGHLVERGFGQSRQSAGQWLSEWAVTSVLFGLPMLLLAAPLVMYLRWWPLLLLPAVGGLVALRLVYYEWLFLPVLSLFYPVRYLRTECLHLPGVGRRMLPVYEVKVSHKTRRANAGILLGRHPRVLVTDTLLEAFTDAEERVAIAHEFGHLYDHLFLEARTAFGLAQAKRKLLWNGAAWLFAGLLTMALEGSVAGALHLPSLGDPAGVPLLGALFLLFAPAVLPLANAEARTDEREADEYAIRITHDASSYLSLMEKVRRLNLEERRPGFISRLFFDTHPSYLERIRLGRAMRKQARALPSHGWSHSNRHHASHRHHVHGPHSPHHGPDGHP